MSLMRAGNEESRAEELERLLVDHARPTVEMVLARFRTSDRAVGRDEVDDVRATVTLRLVRKLRAIEDLEDEVIRDFESYVATLTYRTIYDFMRDRYPERTRLKNRLRYLLGHDARFALWSTATGLVCGLRRWTGRDDALETFTVSRGMATRTMLDRDRPQDAVFAIFERAGRPLGLDLLVAIVAELWGVMETRLDTADDHAIDDSRSRAPSHAARYETRQFLETLWDEIRLLPPNQRTALLFNLRDPDGVNAVALLVLVGVARFDEIAEVMGLAREELTALWETLPLDDATIAVRLGLTRQQVINLRRSARERLARRTLLHEKYERRRG